MNGFRIHVMEDGKVQIKSQGGFTSEVHKDADELLKALLELYGGEVVITKDAPNLANHQDQHHHGKGHQHL